jgi:hypothetical protein
MICGQSTRSRPNSEHDVDRVSIFRKLLRPLDVESRSGQQTEANDIKIDSIHSNGAETNRTNTNMPARFYG